MKRPVAVAGFSCLFTQLLAAFLPPAALWLLAAFFVLLALGAYGLRAKARHGMLLAACAVLAALLLRQAYIARHVQPQLALAGTRGTVTAAVLETRDSYQSGLARVVLQITQYTGADAPRKFKVTADAVPYTPPGELVRFTAQLAALPSGEDARVAQADDIWLCAQDVAQWEWLGLAQTGQAKALRLRTQIASNIATYWPGDIAAVAAAMSIGEKSALSSEVRAAFRSAGLSHALVVSGLHLSIVCGFVFSLLRFLLRGKYAALGAIAAAGLFAAVTGFTPSILRAGIAMLLFYGAQVCGRKSDALNSLGLAALALCCANPFAATDIGLLLSFSATLGVLAAGAWADARRAQRAARREEMQAAASTPQLGAHPSQVDVHSPQPGALRDKARAAARGLLDRLAELLAVPVCTTVATLPVLAAAGIGVSLVSVVCNVLAVPLLSLIVPCGLVLGVWNGALWFEPVARVAGLVCGLCLRWVLAVAAWADSLPWAVVTVTGAAAVCTILGAAALLWLGRKRGVKLRFSLAGAALFVLLAGGGYALLDKDVARVAVVGTGTEPAVVVTQGLHTAVVFRGGEGNLRAVERWLQKNNRDTVDLLVDLRRSDDAAEAALLAQQLCAQSAVRAQSLTNRVTQQTFCGILITIGRQKSGNYAAVELGGVSIAVTVGSVDLAAYPPATVYVAGMTAPENLACDTMLLPPKMPAWLREEMPAVPVRTVEGELCLLVRRGKSMQWKGAMP